MSVLVLLQIVLLLVAVTLPVLQYKLITSKHWDDDLNELKTQHIQLGDALNILKNHRHVAQALSVSTDTIDSITLSLIESIKLQAHAEQVELTQLTVTQSESRQERRKQSYTEPSKHARQIESIGTDSTYHALRVKFAVTMDRAMGLIPLIESLRVVADWRPIEVRGCSVVRLKASPVSLHASCSVDVYYFPELHT